MTVSHLAALDECAGRARALTSGLSDIQINWRPDPGRWSIAECLLHLAETAHLYDTEFRKAIARGRARGLTGEGPFEPSWLGGWLARELEPPPKRGYRAPRRFRPARSEAPAAEVMAAYEAGIAAIRDARRAAEGLDLGRIRMRSPVTSLLRFNMEAGFRIHAAHERRHLWQRVSGRHPASRPRNPPVPNLSFPRSSSRGAPRCDSPPRA